MNILLLKEKKTITTEFRYIDECEAKGFIDILSSPSDARKKLIKPSEITINSMTNWFKHFNKLTKDFIENYN